MLGQPYVDDCDQGTDAWEPVSHWELYVELGPYLVNCAHHIGCTSSAAYEHSALSRELVGSLIEAAQWGDRPADFIVRSHRHRSSSASIPTQNGRATVYVTPGWQLKTAFVHRLGASMRRPQIGGLGHFPYVNLPCSHTGWFCQAPAFQLSP